jgi:hypothetical protein
MLVGSLVMELGRELGDWLAMVLVQEKDQLMVMSLVERLADQCTSSRFRMGRYLSMRIQQHLGRRLILQ